MLDSLRVRSVRLLTNNPRKVDDLARHGIAVTERLPLVIPPNEHNRFYLETKALRSGHLIDLHEKKHLLEQDDRPVVEGMSPEQIELLLQG